MHKSDISWVVTALFIRIFGKGHLYILPKNRVDNIENISFSSSSMYFVVKMYHKPTITDTSSLMMTDSSSDDMLLFYLSVVLSG